MGWYDNEKGWWPSWATRPVAWVGSLMVAFVPTSIALSAWDVFFPAASPLVALGLYVGCAALLLAAIRPWSHR